MGYIYEVGDIVTMKKPHPCGSKDWEIPKGRSGLPAEMHRVRAPDYDRAQTGGKNTKDLKKKS